ncbi:hypothetical protein BH20GEM1_BH20GEM1_06260 [soil metagenome]
MGHRIWTIALAAAAMAAGCENSPSTGVEGTYELTVSIHTDTCTGQPSAFGSEVMIEREGDNVTFRFGDEATLTGTFNPEDRVMTVQGTILGNDPDGGTFTGQMHMVARVTEGQFVSVGSITFEGTFPDVSGTCEQIFSSTGTRFGLSPLPLTGS